MHADPQTNVLFPLSCPLLQPCCRSDGDSWLEVHGGVSPSPGCRSLPLSGFSPVPFSWTPTQAPQTVLTASLLGIYTHTHSHKHTHATQHNISPLTHRTDTPLAVTSYTTYILPQVDHFSPIHSCCICSSWTVREDTAVNGGGGGGRVGQVDLWSGCCCCLQGNHNQTLFLLSPGIMRSDIVLFSMCEVKILQHPVSSFLGIHLEGRTWTRQPQKEPRVQKFGGLDDKSVCLIIRLLCSLFSIWSRSAGSALKHTDTWACGGFKKGNTPPRKTTKG